jgi:hypothetical protein
MADYTYERYTNLARKFGRLIIKAPHDDARYTEEMLTIRAKLALYQAHEDLNCSMWRPWENLVQHVVEEYLGEYIMFTDNGLTFSLLEAEDSDEEEEEEETEVAPIAPAPIKIRRA